MGETIENLVYEYMNGEDPDSDADDEDPNGLCARVSLLCRAMHAPVAH
jgi:hypothetical protein